MAQPTKIVIVGGGMSGLAAAFGLTCAPNWQRQYEIMVLQEGWEDAKPEASTPVLFEGVLRVLEWVVHTVIDPTLASSPTAVADSQSVAHFANSNKPSWIASVVAKAEAAFDPSTACYPTLAATLAGTQHPTAIRFLLQAYKVLRTAPPDPKDHPKELHEAACWLLDAFRSSFRRLTADVHPSDDRLRRILILVDLGIAEATGTLNDLHVVESLELRNWFTQNGALPDSVNSLMFWRALVRPSDAAFAPLHQTLQSRGVELRLAKKAIRLKLDEGRTSIDAIEQGDGDTLHAAQDFDLVALAIPSTRLSETCGELVAANPDWADMVQRIRTAPGCIQYRMGPEQSGFDNLYLAGDWTLSGLHFGYMESATMGGLEISRAICGYPREIVGETEF